MTFNIDWSNIERLAMSCGQNKIHFVFTVWITCGGFFFVCLCVLFFCFILFVCFCIPLIVLCSKQKQVSKPGIEIDAGMLDVSSICVYSLKTCFKALIARGFFFNQRTVIIDIIHFYTYKGYWIDIYAVYMFEILLLYT